MPRLIGTTTSPSRSATPTEAIAFFERIFGPLPLRGRGRRMAFIDMGDQFIALEAVPADALSKSHGRHVGLVVDDVAAVVDGARAAGATMIGDHDFLDPWGNHWQVVDYRDVQFTKAPRILDRHGPRRAREVGARARRAPHERAGRLAPRRRQPRRGAP